MFTHTVESKNMYFFLKKQNKISAIFVIHTYIHESKLIILGKNVNIYLLKKIPKDTIIYGTVRF